jgi:DNA polymerase-3 subunit delta
MAQTEQRTSHGTLYILHGDDALAIHRAVKELIAQDGVDVDTAHNNITWLDGHDAGVNEIYNAAYTLPFFTTKTRVVVTDPLIKIQTKDSQEKFLRMLEGLPESTLLVMVIEDVYESYGKNKGWQKLSGNSWLGKWAGTARAGCAYKIYKLPNQKKMPEIIRTETERQGGKISYDAAKELADRIGNDTYLASQEVAKLLLYVDFKRIIETEDVRQISTSGGTAGIFNLVDAIALGNSNQAIRTLHILLEEEEPEDLFPMIIRQFRLLIQTRALLDAGGNMNAVMKALHIVEFVAEKLMSQVRRFKAEDLSAIYHRLLRIDADAKTSAMPLDVALDDLIVSLAK